MRSTASARRGATAVEYLALVGLVALCALAGARAFGATAASKADRQAGCVETLACEATGIDPSSGRAHERHRPWYRRAGGHVLGAAKGFGHGALDTALGLGELGVHRAKLMALSPGDPFGLLPWSPLGRDNLATLRGLGSAALHPKRTYHSASAAISDAWRSDPDGVVGRGIFEVVTIVLPTKVAKIKYARDLAEASKLADAAELIEAERGVAKVVEAERAVRAARAADDARLVGRLPERLRKLLRRAPEPVEPRFGWQDVNGFPHGGTDINCTRCVAAVDSTLEGAPSSALPMRDAAGLPTSDLALSPDAIDLDELAARLGQSPAGWSVVAPDQAAAVQAVEAWGPGTKGIVYTHYTHDGVDAAHVFNVINDGGDVLFLDGQTGALGDANFAVDELHDVRVLRTRDWSP